MTNNEYARLSLELHLFFDRIMKEHSFFLEVAFTEKNDNYKKIARDFRKAFSDILTKAINLADENISSEFLASSEMVTKNTLEAEEKTRDLSGVVIDTNITRAQYALRSGKVSISEQTLNQISNLNSRTLLLINNLIEFKDDILNRVLSCKMYTTNYPLLISHILNEAKMYHMLLEKIEKRELLSKEELFEQELFWNTIMKEHAQFIRGLLDPSEEELILAANKYADEYKKIIKNYGDNPINLTNASLKETISFRDFKVTGEEGILNCKVKSIIIPLLADHVVREANHFIRILESISIY